MQQLDTNKLSKDLINFIKSVETEQSYQDVESYIEVVKEIMQKHLLTHA